MTFVPHSYIEVLKRRNFFILILTLLLGQTASGFLLISLISSVFTKTGSNFAVSGIILSLSASSFLMMAFAGLVADIFDRRKLIIFANAFITLVVFLILFSLDRVFASISLSFLYFAGNTFFLPAISAATAQVVRKEQLTVANSVFILSLAGGQIIGLFIAAFILFFFGVLTALVICEILLVISVFLPMLLPKLEARKSGLVTLFFALKDIGRAFIYIFSSKIIWFFFLTFALMQGIVAFGATLGPGFFNDVLNIPINKSPIVFFPALSFGIVLGALYVHNPKVKESFLVSVGLGIVGLFSVVLGLIIKFALFSDLLLFLPVIIYMASVGFGVIVAMIAARTFLQKSVSHKYQGTVFGANMIFASLFASVASPLAATLEVLFGYVFVLISGGLVFMVISAVIDRISKRWQF